MTTANNPVVTPELLPCPFCGSGEGSQQIVGKIVRCSCGSSMEAAQESWAISAWNTRAMTQASPPPDEMVERVARAICEADGEIWRARPEIPAVGMHDYDFDALNNHWRHKARAALKSIGIEGQG